jgi:predicted molibdopterin-dependent oxidoreductase YjgC
MIDKLMLPPGSEVHNKKVHVGPPRPHRPVLARRVDKLMGEKPRPVLQLDPTVARRYGIGIGTWVAVDTRRGRAEYPVEITPDFRPDTLFNLQDQDSNDTFTF